MTGHELDISAFLFFAPMLAFLIVFLVIFMLLKKTKIFGDEHPWVDVFFSFLIATIFVTVASVRQVVLDVVPWFALLLVSLFLILMLIGFLGKTEDFVGKGVGWAFIIVLILIFLVAGIRVFAHVLSPYLPGPYFGAGGDPLMVEFFAWLYSARVFGAILLLGIAALVGWVLVKFGK
jgi:hypothetical protein